MRMKPVRVLLLVAAAVIVLPRNDTAWPNHSRRKSCDTRSGVVSISNPIGARSYGGPHAATGERDAHDHADVARERLLEEELGRPPAEDVEDERDGLDAGEFDRPECLGDPLDADAIVADLAGRDRVVGHLLPKNKGFPLRASGGT